MLDLPIADLIETELYKHVQEKEQRRQQSSQTPKDLTLSQPLPSVTSLLASSTISASNSISTSASSPSHPRISQVFQGYWLLESFTSPNDVVSGRRPSLLHLTPAMTTKGKSQQLKEMEEFERQKKQGQAGTTTASTLSSSSSSASASASASASSLSPSYTLSSSSRISVLVPSSVIDLLAESSDGGVGWTFNLELTKYEDSNFGSPQQPASSYFHITKSGHVNCA